MSAKLFDFFLSVSQMLSGWLSVDWDKHSEIKEFFRIIHAQLAQWFTDPATLGTILTVSALVAWVVRKFFWTHRSKLRQPDRFKLSADDPRHLAGRTADVQTLTELCEKNSLTFLIGESGAGKSALVRSGLLPYLKAPNPEQASPLLPLLIDASGLAWEGGLRAALEEALQQMPEAWLPLLGNALAPASADPLPIQIDPHKRQPKKRLLLVLDQIDDYFLAHPDAFVGKDGVVAEPLQMLSANRDWKMLADKVVGKQLHLLLVCRTDAAMLSALNFTGSRSFRLRRIETNRMGQLLDEITRPDAQGEMVEYPEGGWLQLKDRLLDDLADADGQILPVRLSLALDALSRSGFGSLTLSRYTQHGGVRGLERRYLESYWPDIKRLGYEPTAVLRALLLLTAEDGSKTQAASRAAFEQALTKGQAPGKDIGALLENLVDYRLLRIVRGKSKQDEHTLLLYHDYLAHVVREAYRQANRWTELLRVKTAEFDRALTLRQRWTALLSLRDQLGLLMARLRGRFNYGVYRGLAGWSLLRLGPLVMALGLVLAAGWQVDEMKQEQKVAKLLNRVGVNGNRRTKDELAAWRSLGQMGEHARIYALRLALLNPGIRDRLTKSTGPLAHAVLGFDTSGHLSTNIAKELIIPCVAPSKKVARDVKSFCGEFAGELNLKSGSPVLKSLAAALLDLMKVETDSGRLSSMGGALATLAGKLEPTDVKPLAAALVERMKAETDYRILESLGVALAALAGELERTDVKPLAAALVERMKGEPHSWRLVVLGEQLARLADKLEPADVKPGAAALVERMKVETYYFDLKSLGEALGGLADKLEAKDVQPGAAALVERMKVETDFHNFLWLSQALGGLADKLEAEDLQPGAAVLVERMKTTESLLEVGHMGEVLSKLAGKLDAADVFPGAAVVLERMNAARWCDDLDLLGGALAGLVGKLDATVAKLFAGSLVAEMKTGTDSVCLWPLGEVLAALAGKLDGGDVRLGAAVLVERMKVETNSYSLESLGVALAALADKLDSVDVKPGAAALVERMKTETDSERLVSLGEALAGLSGKLDSGDVQPGAAALVERMKVETNSYRLESLGKALTALAGKLEPADVKPLAAALVERMKVKAETDSDSLSALGGALAGVVGHLDGGDAKPFATVLVERMKSETKPDRLSALGKALGKALAGLSKKPASGAGTDDSPIRVADYVELLRQPLIVGEARKALLDGLGKLTGKDFHGDLWQFVDWAQTEEGPKLVPSLE